MGGHCEKMVALPRRLVRELFFVFAVSLIEGKDEFQES
jgi:hypothetical protein